MGQGPLPPQIARAPIQRAQDVVVGRHIDARVVGHGRGHHGRARAPAPTRGATPQVDAVQRAAGRAHQKLIVERGEAGRHSAERARPDRLAGGQGQGHGTAVGETQIEVGEGGSRRHMRHGAERRAPLQFAVDAAKGREVAALERQDQPARVPVRRGRHDARQRALPDGRAGARAERPHAAVDHREHQIAAHGHGEGRRERDLPPRLAGVEIPRQQRAVTRRGVGRLLIERWPRGKWQRGGRRPAQIERPPAKQRQGRPWRRGRRRRCRRRGRQRR